MIAREARDGPNADATGERLTAMKQFAREVPVGESGSPTIRRTDVVRDRILAFFARHLASSEVA